MSAYTTEDFDFFTEACKRGQAVSCSNLAVIYEENELVPQNVKKAKQLYTKACGGDDAFACHNLAVIYGKSDNQALKNIALKFYKKACAGGYAKSCMFLGRFYRDSHTLRRDYKKAKEMFSLACDANNYLGCKEERILRESGY